MARFLRQRLRCIRHSDHTSGLLRPPLCIVLLWVHRVLINSRRLEWPPPRAVVLQLCGSANAMAPRLSLANLHIASTAHVSDRPYPVVAIVYLFPWEIWRGPGNVHD